MQPKLRAAARRRAAKAAKVPKRIMAAQELKILQGMLGLNHRNSQPLIREEDRKAYESQVKQQEAQGGLFFDESK